MKKKSPTKRKLVIPTFEKLSAMTLAERTKVFIGWLKNKRGEYNYFDTYGCPLAQFARRVFRKNSGCRGGFCTIFLFDGDTDGVSLDVLDEQGGNALSEESTYSVLLKRLVEQQKS